MRQTEIPLFVGLILVIAAAPFLPTPPLLVLDWLVARIAVAILLLYFVSVGPVVAVFGFIALAILYMERNRRKVQVGLKKWDLLDTASKLAPVEEAHKAQTTVRVAPFDTPDADETEYAPLDEEPLDISIFEPVAPSLNQKVVLASSYPVSHQPSSSTASMTSIYEQMGVGHVRQVETIGQ